MPKLTDDSSDEDIFLRGGVPKPASLSLRKRSTTDQNGSDSDSDSDFAPVDLTVSPKKKKQPGRPTKRARPTKTTEKQNQVKSVFDNPYPLDEVHDVDIVKAGTEDSEDEDDRAVQESLRRARYTLDVKANEQRVKEQADRIARREAEIAELERQELKKREKQEILRRKQQLAVNQKLQNAPPIHLKVQAKGGLCVTMRIRKSDKMHRMLDAFCNKFKLDRSKAVMMVDGEEVTADETPATYDLEDKMLVEVHIREK